MLMRDIARLFIWKNLEYRESLSDHHDDHGRNHLATAAAAAAPTPSAKQDTDRAEDAPYSAVGA